MVLMKVFGDEPGAPFLTARDSWANLDDSGALLEHFLSGRRATLCAGTTRRWAVRRCPDDKVIHMILVLGGV